MHILFVLIWNKSQSHQVLLQSEILHCIVVLVWHRSHFLLVLFQLEIRFKECTKFQQISVENSNSAFVSIDWILFSIDMQTIICHPPHHPNSIYDIPTSVTSISDMTFYICSYLSSIAIPSSVISIGDFAFLSALIWYPSQFPMALHQFEIVHGEDIFI